MIQRKEEIDCIHIRHQTLHMNNETVEGSFDLKEKNGKFLDEIVGMRD